MQHGKFSIDQLLEKIEAGHINTVMAAGVDMQGRLAGKRIPARYFSSGPMRKGFEGCAAALASDLEQNPSEGFVVCNWNTGYQNLHFAPDLATLRPMPHVASRRHALVICDFLDPKTHCALPHSPRAVLKRQLARLEERGYSAMFASELEFFLFDESHKQAAEKGWRKMSVASPDHHQAIMLTGREEPVMGRMRDVLEDMGINLEGSMCELWRKSSGKLQ